MQTQQSGMQQLEQFLAEHHDILELIQSEELLESHGQAQMALSQKTYSSLKRLVGLIKQRPAAPKTRVLRNVQLPRMLTLSYLQSYYGDRLQQEQQLRQALEVTRPYARTSLLNELRGGVVQQYRELQRKAEEFDSQMAGQQQAYQTAQQQQQPIQATQQTQIKQQMLQEHLEEDLKELERATGEYNYSLKLRFLLAQIALVLKRINPQEYQTTTISFAKALQAFRNAAAKFGPAQLAISIAQHRAALQRFQCQDAAAEPADASNITAQQESLILGRETEKRMADILKQLCDDIQLYVIFWLPLPGDFPLQSTELVAQLVESNAVIQGLCGKYYLVAGMLKRAQETRFTEECELELEKVARASDAFRQLPRAYLNCRVISGLQTTKEAQEETNFDSKQGDTAIKALLQAATEKCQHFRGQMKDDFSRLISAITNQPVKPPKMHIDQFLHCARLIGVCDQNADFLTAFIGQNCQNPDLFDQLSAFASEQAAFLQRLAELAELLQKNA